MYIDSSLHPEFTVQRTTSRPASIRKSPITEMSGIPKPSRLLAPRPVMPNVPATVNHAIGAMKTTKPTINAAPAIGNRLKRAASPSLDGTGGLTMAKKVHLRRSKSVVDLRKPAHRQSPPAPLRRAVSRLNLTKPAVSAMNLATATKATTSTLTRTNTATNASRPGVRTGAPTLQRTRTQLGMTATTATGANKRPGATATAPSTAKKGAAVSTNSAAGVAKKKIPPYDFKARYLDLSERHETLKEKYTRIADDQEHLVEIEEKYQEAKQQVEVLQPEVQTLRAQNLEFSEDKQMLEMKVDRLTTTVNTTKSQLEETRGELEFLQSEHLCIKEENDTLKQSLKKSTEEAEFFKEEFFRLEMERKRLHNTIMDLKGNIRVFCRIRPPLDNENDKMLCQWNMHDETSFDVTAYDSHKKKTVKADFNFDQVFHMKSSQEDVFENVSPLIQSALDGYNVCIFAYGQTGSGKSYTMDGTRDNAGIIPRTVDLLYHTIAHLNRCGWTYELKASFLEIYNEVLCDLLDPKAKQMDIKMASTSNQKDIYVSNIKEVTVTCARDLRQLIEQAKGNRITACTAGNERSSRSHAVTQITVEGRHRDRKWELTRGTINLVDLAGSESGKTSTRMDETKNINRSLSELTNVMLALVKKSNHVPYRNSKLTHLLMPSLGGNSKTLMVVNVNPLDDHFTETNKSLRFASTVNTCTMAKAKKVKILQEQESVTSD